MENLSNPDSGTQESLQSTKGMNVKIVPSEVELVEVLLNIENGQVIVTWTLVHARGVNLAVKMWVASEKKPAIEMFFGGYDAEKQRLSRYVPVTEPTSRQFYAGQARKYMATLLPLLVELIKY